MFVTILTIIYSAIAIFIIVRFLRENANKMANWAGKVYQKTLTQEDNWKALKSEKKKMHNLSTEIEA